jgi:endonuclease-3
VSESLKSKRERTSAVTTLLERFQGEPRWEGPSDPLDSLVRTLLSQSTNDNNRDLAYGRLRRGFHTWREVMEAPRAAVAEAIRPAGLSNQKSERLIAMLRWIEAEFGELNLGFLHEMPIDEAFKRFTRVKGIGVKTVAVVLMFACGRDVFPVDTHVHRIVRRLGLVPDKADAVKTFELMAPLVPPGKSYSLHMNLLRFGRTVCTARKPKCLECSLYDLCKWPEKPKKN